jgi:hypothetical protein
MDKVEVYSDEEVNVFINSVFFLTPQKMNEIIRVND